MIAIGFVTASACIYRHLEKQIRVCPHTDTTFFSVTSSMSDSSLWNCKSSVCHESRNPWTPGFHDCVQSIRVLGRVVERTADDITWEADLPLVELTRKSFGVTGRSVTTPGGRDKFTDKKGEVPIEKEASDRYRANTITRRCCYDGKLHGWIWN